MTPQTTTTSCGRCGRALESGSRFCAHCGTAAGATLNATAANTTPIPVVPRPGATPPPKPEDQVVADLREATLGDFDVYAELGRGGMAFVYLALDLALNRPVAIKVMSPALIYGEGMTERFKREARTAASLSHPNIIPIYAVKETPKILFFVMKYVEGRPLDSIVKELATLPLPMVHTVLTQVGGALAYAHRRGVVHRDIKPANILIDEEGWAIVTDFGIAKVQEAKGLTSTGAMVGTPHYMSPEQYSGTALSGASDQYSLGVVAYELLGGKPPFNGDTIAEVMKGHLFDPPQPLNEIRSDCPPALVELVMRMLSKKPADRFPTLDDAVKALAAVNIKQDHHVREQLVELAKTGLQHRPRISVPQSPIPLGKRATPPSAPAATPRVAPPVSAKGERKTSGMLYGGIAAALLVLAGGGYFAMQKFGTPQADATVAAAPAAETPAQDSITPGAAQVAASPNAPAPAVVTPPVTEREAKVDPPVTKQPAVDPAAERRRLQQLRADSIRIASAAAAEARKESDRLAREKADREEADRRTREAAIAAAKVPPKEPERAPAPVQVAAAGGKIKITTRVPNVTIHIDGKSAGALSGLRTLDVEAGSRSITLSAPGCSPWDSTVNVNSGGTTTVGNRGPKC